MGLYGLLSSLINMIITGGVMILAMLVLLGRLEKLIVNYEEK